MLSIAILQEIEIFIILALYNNDDSFSTVIQNYVLGRKGITIFFYSV